MEATKSLLHRVIGENARKNLPSSLGIKKNAGRLLSNLPAPYPDGRASFLKKRADDLQRAVDHVIGQRLYFRSALHVCSAESDSTSGLSREKCHLYIKSGVQSFPLERDGSVQCLLFLRHDGKKII